MLPSPSPNALILAQQLAARNLAPIPIIGGTKRAACYWKRFQNVGPSDAQLQALFNRPNLEVGIVCGAASDNLLVFDGENPEIVARTRDALGDPLTPIVQTRRGAHIYVHTSVPVKSTRIADMCVRGQAEYVLAPGARHPSGVLYRFIRESDTIYTLPALDAIPWLPLEPAPAESKLQRPVDMPLLAWQVLRGYVTPVTHPQYQTRSECEAAAVTALINARWTFERVLDAFRRLAHPETKYKTKAQRDVTEADDWLRLTFDECGEFARTHESETVKTIHRLRAWALDRTWTGKTGAYDRAVYLAHLSVAGRASKTTYGADVRSLAERALVSLGAVSSANKRLIAQDLLRIQIPGIFTFPTIYQLERAFVSYLNTYPPTNVEEVFKYETIQALNVQNAHFAGETALDLFSWQGLGKSGAQVWFTLQSEEWQSIGKIVKETGRGKSTVWRVLARMFDLGLVEKRGNGNATEWRRFGDADLQRAARALGVSGTRSDLVEKHKADRRKHQQQLEYQRQPRLFGTELK